MATKITKEKLLNDLNKIKDIIELPSFYFSNYFSDLRNDVDKQLAPKQLELQNDKEKMKELNELWQQMIAKIDLFEFNFKRDSYNLKTIKTKINEIEARLNTQERINLNDAEDIIENEQINLLEMLFKKKSILLVTIQKLVILNDEFISKTSLQKR